MFYHYNRQVYTWVHIFISLFCFEVTLLVQALVCCQWSKVTFILLDCTLCFKMSEWIFKIASLLHLKVKCFLCSPSNWKDKTINKLHSKLFFFFSHNVEFYDKDVHLILHDLFNKQVPNTEENEWVQCMMWNVVSPCDFCSMYVFFMHTLLPVCKILSSSTITSI